MERRGEGRGGERCVRSERRGGRGGEKGVEGGRFEGDDVGNVWREGVWRT